MLNFWYKKLNKKGFTLAELLIVIAIIVILVGIAIPAFTSTLAKARKATDQANLRGAASEYMTWALTNEVYDVVNKCTAAPIVTFTTKAVTIAAPAAKANEITYSIDYDSANAFTTVTVPLAYYTAVGTTIHTSATPADSTVTWTTLKNTFLFGK